MLTVFALTLEMYAKIVLKVAVRFVGENVQCDELVTPVIVALSDVPVPSVIEPDNGSCFVNASG
jgi:hypothetical protein